MGAAWFSRYNLSNKLSPDVLNFTLQQVSFLQYHSSLYSMIMDWSCLVMSKEEITHIMLLNI